jgi:hypothetical protein
VKRIKTNLAAQQKKSHGYIHAYATIENKTNKTKLYYCNMDFSKQ